MVASLLSGFELVAIRDWAQRLAVSMLTERVNGQCMGRNPLALRSPVRCCAVIFCVYLLLSRHYSLVYSAFFVARFVSRYERVVYHFAVLVLPLSLACLSRRYPMPFLCQVSRLHRRRPFTVGVFMVVLVSASGFLSSHAGGDGPALPTRGGVAIMTLLRPTSVDLLTYLSCLSFCCMLTRDPGPYLFFPCVLKQISTRRGFWLFGDEYTVGVDWDSAHSSPHFSPLFSPALSSPTPPPPPSSPLSRVLRPLPSLKSSQISTVTPVVSYVVFFFFLLSLLFSSCPSDGDTRELHSPHYLHTTGGFFFLLVGFFFE